MQQTKRHHYVPKAYLNAFRDAQGKLLQYRKDAPSKPLRQVPDGMQFRRYYYSQPTPDGGQDNNKLEQLFSTIETPWPDIVAKLHKRESVNDRVEEIFAFITLQRIRSPAARDLAEGSLAQGVKTVMMKLRKNDTLPSMPDGGESLFDKIEIAIDPHQSLLAMPAMAEGIAKLYEKVGIAAIHNSTGRSFLTSDNPVIWFDPSISFDAQLPYDINPDRGPIFLYFPISPKVALIGSTEYWNDYGRNGLMYTDVPDAAWVENMNAQICRYAYEAVIAQGPGEEELIQKYASVAPVLEAQSSLLRDRGHVNPKTGFSRAQTQAKVARLIANQHR